MMRVLIYGGSDYYDWDVLYKFLDDLLAQHSSSLILIQSGGPGAENMARVWGYERGVHYATVNAHWYKTRRRWRDKAAGAHCNTAMLLLQPELGIELPGGRDTNDMREKLTAAGIPIKRLLGA